MQREISAILGKGKVVLRETERSVTPYGGVVVMAEYLKKVGYVEQVSQAMPIQLKSPNAIAPVDTYTAFLFSVLAGARRFAHANLLRGDRGLHVLLGIKRFPTDDTIRNLFKRFTQRLVYEFYSVLWSWQIARVPQREDGYSLDLDSTVFERYGRQEGALKGHNPRKHGRPSHHPLFKKQRGVRLDFVDLRTERHVDLRPRGMPRKPRIEICGGLYHVITRGNNRRTIFRSRSGRQLINGEVQL